LTDGGRRPIVVLGATASGKSDVAMALAAESPGTEIVAVDAMQVYRGMDIGTAKPSAADRAMVPHHCLDLVEPTADFTVTEFERAARDALVDIAARHARPLLVAGTGLYLRALTDPMDIPGQWPDVRATLEQRAGAEGPHRLHAELAALDPLAASRMEPSNTRRVVRALEVTLGSGRPFSSFGPGISTFDPTPFRMLGLRWPRPVLHERIAARVERMMQAGLLEEVRALTARHADLSRTARQALGYKELLDHLDGATSLDAAVASIVLRTRQFAVRQERWFRRDPRVRWCDIDQDPVAEVAPAVVAALHA
jgi:tRNA dimethylallyltransferase